MCAVPNERLGTWEYAIETDAGRLITAREFETDFR